MNDEAGAFLFGALIGLLGGFLIAASVMVNVPSKESASLRNHAVEHGYAKYELNQSTGEVEFKWEEKK